MHQTRSHRPTSPASPRPQIPRRARLRENAHPALTPPPYDPPVPLEPETIDSTDLIARDIDSHTPPVPGLTLVFAARPPCAAAIPLVGGSAELGRDHPVRAPSEFDRKIRSFPPCRLA